MVLVSDHSWSPQVDFELRLTISPMVYTVYLKEEAPQAESQISAQRQAVSGAAELPVIS